MVRSVVWFTIAAVAVIAAAPFLWSAAYIAWFADSCAEWVPLACGQGQTIAGLVLLFGGLAAFRQGVEAWRSSEATEPSQGSGTVTAERDTKAKTVTREPEDFAAGTVWRVGDSACTLWEGDGDLMWLANVDSAEQGRWALTIDRVLSEDDPESESYQDFGQWSSEARAFAAVEGIGYQYNRGDRMFRFADDFGGVIEVDGDDAYAAEWSVAAPLLPDKIE